MKNQGKIIVVSGPSGVGKGTINSQLFDDEKLRLVYSVSMTTREPRPGELNGVNYYFSSCDQFKKAIENNELIEHAEFIGNYYGTPRKLVQEQTKMGKNVILEIEVEGATQVIQNEENVLSIFLTPPSFYELQNRIITRGTEAKEIIKKRLTKSLFEIPLKNKYQYVVENDSVENAIAKIRDILMKEKITDYTEKSGYEKLVDVVEKILEKDYVLFIEIICDNFENLSSKYQEKLHKETLVADLAIILADKIYHHILAHGQFSNLDNLRDVQILVNTLMMDVDFFGVKNDCQ